MPAPCWLTAQPIAHRGLHDSRRGIVENTLPAVEAAVLLGFGIEVDVQAARDLEPVVFHDPTLDRLTPAEGAVAEWPTPELTRLAVAGTGERIPTLADVLQSVAGRVPVLVEVKTDWSGMPAFCKRIADLLRDYDGPAAVKSFDPEAVAAFRSTAPALPRGIVSQAGGHRDVAGLARRLSLSKLLHAARTRPHFISYRREDLPALAPLGLRAAFDLPILAWTVRSEDEWRRAARWADQIVFEDFRPLGGRL